MSWKRILWMSLLLSTTGCRAAAPPAWGALYPQVVVTTDYRYDGMSLSDNQPAVQGSLYWLPPLTGFYAGLWTSTVDFRDEGNTSWEVTAYAGRSFAFDLANVTLEAQGTTYPDQTSPGPTYDFFKASVELDRSWRDLTTTATASWIPDAAASSGEAWLAVGGVEYGVHPRVVVGGQIGRRWVDGGFDRTYWDAGVTLLSRYAELEVRYADTNLERSQCFFLDWCSPTLLATLTLNLWR